MRDGHCRISGFPHSKFTAHTVLLDAVGRTERIVSQADLAAGTADVEELAVVTVPSPR